MVLSGKKLKAPPAATQIAPSYRDASSGKPPSRLDKSDDFSNTVSDTRNSKSKRHVRFHQNLDDLRKEMEVVPYYGVVAETGQLRRKPLRRQAKVQTRKRKILEKQDVQEFTVERDEVDIFRKRLRGPRAAEEDVVILGSMVFGGTEGARINQQSAAAPTVDSEVDDLEEEQYDQDQASEFEELDDDQSEEEQNYKEEEESEEEEQEEIEEVEELEDDEELIDNKDETVEEESDEAGSARTPARRLRKSQNSFRRPARRNNRSRIFRLRNFKSMKMTAQHGEALAAFARGKPREAIEKLQQVARELPSAPQVYSSLGMVYEEMLNDLQKKQKENRGDSSASKDASEEHCPHTDELLDNILSEQLALAKKAYGSYHIAALLCKKDYTFWVRAADLAVTIGELHAEIMTLNDMVDRDREHHRSEKQRWLSEAKNDYQTADNIKPPGIDIPAKLAAVCMELGSLSEALTILTDLKNRKPAITGERSDFESSYKAWLLYADLMLRIGHECLKWNEGDQTTENSFFRRWLRRHSRTFEWEERRLQSLGKALEAAAGSKCCSRLTDWLQRRALASTVDSSDVATLVDVSTGGTQDYGNQFEKEKSLLLSKQATELADFDKTTTEIDSETGLMPSDQRGKARSELLLRQKTALSELEDEFGRDKENLSNDLTCDAAHVPLAAAVESDNGPPLALSASVRTVCAIASELLRHMLLLKLFEGGRLVGEAVSLYLKERASSLDKKLQLKKRFEETRNKLNSMLTTVLDSRHGPREGIQEDTSDDESDCAISDDDDLEQSPPLVMATLRKGVLPPELNVLFSLSMLGERGRDFIAFKCLNSIYTLKQESLSDLDLVADSGVSYDVRWTVFKRLRTAPLLRTAAFALLDHVVLSCNREKELAGRLRPLFEAQVKDLLDAQLVDVRADKNSALTIDGRSTIHKVVIAAARFQLKSAESLVSELNLLEADELLKAATGTLTNLLEVVWRVRSDGSVSPTCVDAVGTLARVFRLRTSFSLANDDMLAWVKRMEGIISILCGCPGLELQSDVEESLPDMCTIPIPSAWLSAPQKAISMRAFVLSVSHNVARFSGWEEEFRVDLLRRRANASTHFGIKMSDGLVSGILLPFENEIIDQWDTLQSIISIQPEFSFRESLEKRQLSSWYCDAKTAYEKASEFHSITIYGEDDGLTILLHFSRACLLAARTSQRPAHRNSLVFHALSVILPLMQFILQDIVWDAEIGKVSDARASLVDWRHLSTDERKETESLHDKRLRRRRAMQPKEDMRDHIALHASFPCERSSPLLSNLIVIPCKTLCAAWNAVTVIQLPLSTTSADELMANVHHSLRQLRGCQTEKAVEIASLNVAAAVLNLMAHPDCSNPFLSLQSAALFASQGPKLGSSDSAFRHALPDRDQCCPLEALVILARAECLQAVHFCLEAAFLCDYVASVCRLHLNDSCSQQESHNRWTVIRAVAYNVSVSIRHTASILFNEVERKSDIPSWCWHKTTIDELTRGREDCLAFIGIVQPPQTLLPPGGAQEPEAYADSIAVLEDYFPKTFDEDISSPLNEHRISSIDEDMLDEVEAVAV